MANIEIGGRLHSTATGNVVTGANEVLDDIQNKKQQEINAELIEAVGTGGSIDQRIEDATKDCAYLGENDGSSVIADFDPQTDTVWKKAQTLSNAEKSQVKTNLGLPQEIYSKREVNALVSIPHQNYVTVATYSELPVSGSTDTIYRVSNYDGTQVAAGVYSEYAWSGSAYVFLAAKSSVGEVFDISEYHAGTKYANLAAALDSNNGGGVPQSLQKGGMSVKYVSNSDNKYVQWRLMSQNFSTAESDWQGEDAEPTVGSNNFVKSGGVCDAIKENKSDIIISRNSVVNENRYWNSSLQLVANTDYNCSTYDVSNVAGKRIRVRGNTTSYYLHNSFIKCSDNSIVPLTDCRIYSPDESQCYDAVLPNNANTLYFTWNKNLNDSFFIIFDQTYNMAVSNLTGLNVGLGGLVKKIDEVCVGYYWNNSLNKAYSSGYNCIKFDVALVAGKRIRVRGNAEGYYLHNSYVKCSDNSIVALTSIKAKGLDETLCYDVILPSNAKTLYFTYMDTLADSYFVKYDEAYNRLVDEGLPCYSKVYLTDFQENKYWTGAGTTANLNGYKCGIANVEEYAGKRIRIRLNTGGYWLSNCFLKKTDNSVVALTTLKTVSPSDYECFDVILPNDAKILYGTCTTDEDYYIIYDKIYNESLNNSPIGAKEIFLFGDSISSTDYTWYKGYLSKYTMCQVYNKGLSGGPASLLAKNSYFSRLESTPSDFVIALVGANDKGESGTVGTFTHDSPLAQMGESVVSETDIAEDYNGTYFIQAVSHIIRKFIKEFANFRLSAGINAKLVAATDTTTAIYSGTEKQCYEYAETQGYSVGTGLDYYILPTDSASVIKEKLDAVKHPKLYFCTTLPEKRNNADSPYSNSENWERKRQAIIECCEKYGVNCIDLFKEFAIDWNAEPYYPGMGKTGTDTADNQGIYTMDGLHPNEYGYEWISRIVSSHLK